MAPCPESRESLREGWCFRAVKGAVKGVRTIFHRSRPAAVPENSSDPFFRPDGSHAYTVVGLDGTSVVLYDPHGQRKTVPQASIMGIVRRFYYQ
jgi:hypothetical protein